MNTNKTPFFLICVHPCSSVANPFRSLLKVELQRQLHVARGAGRCDASELSRGLVGIRRREVHVVEGVEEFGPEIQSNALVNVGPLGGAEIHVEVTRPTQDVLTGIAERADGVGREDRGVEVFRNQIAVRAPSVERGCSSDVVGAVAPDTGQRVVAPA